MFTKMPITAPFSGTVSLHAVTGEEVVPGQVIATIEAMKMEVNVTAPVGGHISERCVKDFSSVVSGETVYVLEGRE